MTGSVRWTQTVIWRQTGRQTDTRAGTDAQAHACGSARWHARMGTRGRMRMHGRRCTDAPVWAHARVDARIHAHTRVLLGLLHIRNDLPKIPLVIMLFATTRE